MTSAPIKQGGVAIAKPDEMSDLNHCASTCEFIYLVRNMKDQESFDPYHHSAVVREFREEVKSQRQLKAEESPRKIRRGSEKKGARRLD